MITKTVNVHKIGNYLWILAGKFSLVRTHKDKKILTLIVCHCLCCNWSMLKPGFLSTSTRKYHIILKVLK